jgi:hypothetical protein
VKENEISRACSTNKEMKQTARKVEVYVGAYIVILGWILDRERDGWVVWSELI